MPSARRSISAIRQARDRGLRRPAARGWDGRVFELMTTMPLDVQALLGGSTTRDRPFDGLPDGTVMGHVHLQVSRTSRDGRVLQRRPRHGRHGAARADAAFLSAGGYHHHVGANVSASRGASPPPARLGHASAARDDPPPRRAPSATPSPGGSPPPARSRRHRRGASSSAIHQGIPCPPAGLPRRPAIPVSKNVSSKPVEQLDSRHLRFAGDSGTGCSSRAQLHLRNGSLGNDLSTLPTSPPRSGRRPARCRGSRAFNHFSDHDILTPGDAPNVLVAMNPAALKTNINDLPKGGTPIVNGDAFTSGTSTRPGTRRTHSRTARSTNYQVHPVPLNHSPSGARKRWRA